MEWGEQIDALELHYEITGRKPPALQRRIGLKQHEVYPWRAFQVLSAGRPSGLNGVSAITISEIAAYCDLAGIHDPDRRLYLCRLIQKMDEAYRSAIRERDPPR